MKEADISSFDEYQYNMDGWDGRNDTYKDDADIRLADGLKSLIESGVSPSQIQNRNGKQNFESQKES